MSAPCSSATMLDEKNAADEAAVPAVEREEESRKWATSRAELWAFYVYYIVSSH